MLANELAYFGKTALLALFIGGVTSVFLGNLIAVVDTLLSGLLAIVLAVLLIYLSKFTEVDGLRIAEWIVLLLLLGGFGTIISGFVPQVSPFLLTSTFTVTGLGFAFLYVFISDAIGDKIF